MSERVRIRPARLEECDLLSDLARRSKALWGYDEAFMAACRAELTVQPRQVADGNVFVAELEGAVAGVHALEAGARADELELGLLFVEPALVRRGVGGALFRHAVSRARARGYARLLLQGDPNAAAFYAAQGARRVGELESLSIPGRMLPLLVVDLCVTPPPSNRQEETP